MYIKFLVSSATKCLTLVVFSMFFFFRKKKLPIVVVRDVCPSVRLSVCDPSVVCGNNFFSRISISNRPIGLKIGLNVRKGVAHVRKA